MRALLLIVLAACGDNGNTAQDIDAPKQIDAPPAVRCDVTKPFGAAVKLANVNTTNMLERAGWMLPDGKTLYFIAGSHIRRATRADASADFNAGTDVTELDGIGVLQRLAVTADELYMVLSVGLAGELRASTRTSTSMAWPTPTPITELMGVGSGDLDPWISEDGLELYFARLTGNFELVHTTRASRTAPFATPVEAVMGVNTTGEELSPVVSRDGLEILFGRGTGNPAVDFDVFRATRAAKTAAFDMPAKVTDLSTTMPESPGSLSPDRCALVMERNAGSFDLYIATRPN